jgi:hypothetical protein
VRCATDWRPVYGKTVAVSTGLRSVCTLAIRTACWRRIPRGWRDTPYPISPYWHLFFFSPVKFWKEMILWKYCSARQIPRKCFHCRSLVWRVDLSTLSLSAITKRCSNVPRMLTAETVARSRCPKNEYRSGLFKFKFTYLSYVFLQTACLISLHASPLLIEICLPTQTPTLFLCHCWTGNNWLCYRLVCLKP